MRIKRYEPEVRLEERRSDGALFALRSPRMIEPKLARELSDHCDNLSELRQEYLVPGPISDAATSKVGSFFGEEKSRLLILDTEKRRRSEADLLIRHTNTSNSYWNSSLPNEFSDLSR
jgi:hypothetical protein